MIRVLRLSIGMALLAAAPIASPARADDLVGRDEIVAKLKPSQPNENEKTRSLVIVPSISLDVRFEFDSARLTPEARRQIDELGAALVSDSLRGYRFELTGHTDARGTAEYNQTLSERRAVAVKDHLVQHFGISSPRLSTLGWGFQKLKNPEAPESAENRRVQIANLGKE